MDAEQKIDGYLASVPAWQARNMAAFRALVHKMAPEITEEWKWAVPVFMLNGKILFAMSAFKGHTKFNFLTGAALPDQTVFNSGLDSKQHRSLNSAETDSIDWDELRRAVASIISPATS